MATMVKLKSSQDDIIEVELDVACMSELVKSMFEDCGTDEEFPLTRVNTAILRKVLDYCRHHVNDPAAPIQMPLPSTNLAECGVGDWDVAYVDVEQEILFGLMFAARYLDIKLLTDLTCAKFASMINANVNVEDFRFNELDSMKINQYTG